MKQATISLALITLLSLCPLQPVIGKARASCPYTLETMPREWSQDPQQAVPKFSQIKWPRAYAGETGAGILVYQPQVLSWDNQQYLVALAAVSYLSKGATKPLMGTLKVEGKTNVSLEARMVDFKPLKITEATFQSLSKVQTQEIVAEVEKSMFVSDRVVALDQVLAYLDKGMIKPRNVEGIKAEPPRIFFSKTPAVLVNIDGEPIWSPIKGNALKFAVNTNWDLFTLGPSNSYYLRDGDSWLKASNLKGPWTAAGALPPSFNTLPSDANFKEVKANLPGQLSKKALTVFLSTEPAEMILLDGSPRYAPVNGAGDLLWVNNTESDVFRLNANGPVYYLVAGRWFSAPDFNGPWTFATPNLPEDFKRIPLEHPRSRVLASVPGTQQAAEAVLLAQVPQTARVNRKEVKAPEVVYQGKPEFTPIEGTTLQRAANTDKDIIKVGDYYYMCFQGVWFQGTDSGGPWTVASSVPGEIYEIPASSPSHQVTYVEVEPDDDASDDWITFEAVAGYTGMMVAWGCAVWGTGWYYPAYRWLGGNYPVYFPNWRTYGAAAWYNPHTGFYGTAGRIYGPYGGAGFSARYNPSTGTYARGAAAYGPYRARGVAQAANPRTGTYAATRQGAGVYGSWGSSYVQRGDDWAATQRVTNRATGATTRVTQTGEGAMVSRRASGGSGFVAKGDDNVYAGKDGNVYRRDQNGNWNKFENGGWNQVQRPDGAPKAGDNKRSDRDIQSGSRAGRNNAESGTRATQDAKPIDRSTLDGLERDRSARAEGSQRTRDFSNYRSQGGGNAGSFRSGGGGSASGGGGRRR